MKVKERLQGFSSMDDDVDADQDTQNFDQHADRIEVHKHKPMTYEGICDDGNDGEEGNYCINRPNKCLHGIYD